MKNYLYLLQIFGGGNPKIHEVIRFYGSAQKAAEKISGGDLGQIPPNRYKNAKSASLQTSEMIMDYCRKNRIHIITIDDPKYPVMLKNIFNPPTVLFVDGDIGCLDKRLSVSVVGPRNPDDYGAKLAVNICGALSRCKVVLVSGFAHGIDSIAHSEAVNSNTPTVAVLACGITVDYPKNSFNLRKRIRQSGGAVVSELLPDCGCCAEYFKFRNRIISGLSYATVVIGADNKSGSMLTANHAFEQDRDLFFTMPPDTLNPNYSKIIKYLRDGAHPVYDFYDIINEFYGAYRDMIDSAFLDKDKLSYFSALPQDEDNSREEAPSQNPAENQDNKKPGGYSEPAEKQNKTAQSRSKPAEHTEASKNVRAKAKDAPRFKIKVESDKSKELDYSTVTPESFMKKKRKKPAEKPSDNDISKSVTENSTETAKSPAAPLSEAASDSSLSDKLLHVIREQNGATLDYLLTNVCNDFGALTEALADLEIDGKIACGPGNSYVIF